MVHRELGGLNTWICDFAWEFWNNPGWAYWSWSTETPDPWLLSVFLPYWTRFLPFFIYFLLLAVPNMNDTQIGTSPFKTRNIVRRTTSFASLNMDLGWGEITCHDRILVPVVKLIALMGTWCSKFVLVRYSLIHLYSPLIKLELIQYLAYQLTWGTH